MPIVLENTNDVTLKGIMEKGNLDFWCEGEMLSDNDDTVIVKNSGVVAFHLVEPEGETMSASHEEGGNTVNWATEPTGVGHSFASGMTEPTEVEVAPPKTIYVQVKPTGGLPDT